MRRELLAVLVLLLGSALVCAGMVSGAMATAQSHRVIIDQNTGYAIYGYDPVSYFTDHAAMQGKRQYEFVWQGVSWIFVSQANREVFMADPEVYAPQYGGHGALAMARGYASTSNPNIWAIYRDRLFFFYSYTARAAWAEEVEQHVQRGDEHWPTVNNSLTR